MISCPTISKDSIRFHYDLTTPFYWLLWGRHIHHGLWNGTESPRLAQRQLIEAMIEFGGVRPGSQVVDVGCGMGGSSIHLAKKLSCQVTGVTLSPFQRRWAAASARLSGVRNRTEFRCADAEHVEIEPASRDVVWSIECTEHLFDKPRFFERAAEWLKPGGRMAICAWLSGELPQTPAQDQQVFDVCEGFLCPSLGTMQDYGGWMEAAGLRMVHALDWTNRVAQTWEICLRRAHRTGMPWLARLLDRDSVLFLKRFETILSAYRTGAMQYGCLVAEKPLTPAEANTAKR